MKKIAVLLVLVTLVAGCAGQEIPAPSPNPTNGNDPIMAPHFSLVDLDGKTWSLEELGGEVVVLYFWTVTCPNCINKLPELAELQKDLPGDVNLLLVNGGDSKNSIEKVMGEHTNLTVLIDARTTLGLYGIQYVPTIVFIDKYGKVDQGFIGPISNEDIMEIIEELR